MQYLKIRWKHKLEDEPVLIYSELDEARMETRKVEIFADGTKGYASGTEANGFTMLGEEPVPTTADIASDPEFFPEEITQAEFEKVWSEAVEEDR